MQTPTAARSFIACGMYNFSHDTERAWRALFKPFGEIYSSAGGNGKTVELRFDSTDASYQSPSMVLGHTCGYPLIKKWHRSHQPVSVPVFELPGCEGHRYSSWFISHPGMSRQQLSGFAGTTAAINDSHSNSGMNVLRYALSEVGDCQRHPAGFFSSVIETGSHYNSMLAVADRCADIASIDAVSYHHLLRLYPELAAQTRIIGQSVTTPGLPFIVHRPTPRSGPSTDLSVLITRVLNKCLEMLDETNRALLKLSGFEAVDIDAYQALQNLETTAINRGYGKIR